MDRNYWVRNYEQRVEEWREQRVQKMAARLQLNSNRQRTVSSSVLGYGNYRQQTPVQLDQRQHNEGQRFNHVDRRWNPNYNYSGYQEHKSLHTQYYHTDHRSNRSFHQHAHKKEHFSSQKSLYNKRSASKPNRKYSSCNNINSSSSKPENETVLQSLEPNNETVCEKGFESKVHLNGESSSQINTGIDESLIPFTSLGSISSSIEQDVQIDGKILNCEPNLEVHESDMPESCRKGVSSVIEQDVQINGKILDCEPNSEVDESEVPESCRLGVSSVIEQDVQINGKSLDCEPNSEVDESEVPESCRLGVSSVIEQDVQINGKFLDCEPNLEVHESDTPESCRKGVSSVIEQEGKILDCEPNSEVYESDAPETCRQGVSSVNEQDVQINGKILDCGPNSESDVPESCRQIDFSSAITADEDNVESLYSESSAELCEIYLPVPNSGGDTDNCLREEANFVVGCLLTNSNIEIGGNEPSKPQVELEDMTSPTIPSEVEVAYDMLSEPLYKIHGDVSPNPQNMTDPIQFSPETICIENGDESTEQDIRTEVECTLTFEAAGDSRYASKVKEFVSEPMASDENCVIADGFSELDLSLSFEPDKELVVGDSTVEASELEDVVTEDTESIVKFTDKEREETNGRTSDIESANVVPVALIVNGDSETEASILIGDENDIAKEIEKVENKLANISIGNKNICHDTELITPKKRERRKVLLDATNILQSSAIKYSVQEVRKNDESEIIVTPVRRSLRISSMTPISNKNICVQNLKELTPEVIQKMKFVNNPAIKTPPDY